MFKKGQILKIVDVDKLHLPFSTMFEKGDLFEALEDSDGVGLRVKHLRTEVESWLVEYRFVKAPFQIGDRVIGVKNTEEDYYLIEDVKGTVVDVNPFIRYSDQVYGVRFDKDIKGHTLGGLCKYGYGLWCAEDEIKAIPKEEGVAESKFKAGDRVQIIRNHCSSLLTDLRGLKATVVEVDDYGLYLVEFDVYIGGHDGYPLAKRRVKPGHGWWFIKTALENIAELVVEKKQEVVEFEKRGLAELGLYITRIIYNDPATVLFYEDPITGEEKKVVAKCHPDDTYDKELGKKVAILKAFHKEIPRIIAYETARL